MNINDKHPIMRGPMRLFFNIGNYLFKLLTIMLLTTTITKADVQQDVWFYDYKGDTDGSKARTIVTELQTRPDIEDNKKFFMQAQLVNIYWKLFEINKRPADFVKHIEHLDKAVSSDMEFTEYHAPSKENELRLKNHFKQTLENYAKEAHVRTESKSVCQGQFNVCFVGLSAGKLSEIYKKHIK